MTTDFSNNPIYQFAINANYSLDFKKITPNDLKAFLFLINENRQIINQLIQQTNPTWDNFFAQLESLQNRLYKALLPFSHLHAVNSTDGWRNAYEQAINELIIYGNEIDQNEDLYNLVKKIKERNDFQNLNKSKQKIINDSLQNFELSGVNLPRDKKEALKQIELKLADLSIKFSNNLLDSTNKWKKIITDEKELSGISDHSKSLMKNLAKNDGKDGYLLNLTEPVVNSVLTHSDNRELRKEIYLAYNARASELSDNGSFNNHQVVQQILDLRQQKAEILGFEDYAAYSIFVKMAKESKKVMSFLTDLLKKSQSKANKELSDLVNFAKERLNIDNFEPWDFAYSAEKMRQECFDLSQEELRLYFPLNQVIEGLLSLCKKIFAIDFKVNKQLSTWNDSVVSYDVVSLEGDVIGQFYLDPYARDKKRSGAWMVNAVTRFRQEELQLPVAYLVCNFTPPVNDEISYITHYEVITLFHEFGHGLHHLLSKVDEYSTSGINGVELDAVEQPSQFMENYCYNFNVLQSITSHKNTKEKIPAALVDKIIKAKNFNSSLALLRQLYFSLFDMLVHLKENQNKDVLEILAKAKNLVGVLPSHPNNRLPMQFGHIFAGGYSAGYYSYKWSEVLSADSFSLFEEKGIFNQEIGLKFRNEVLSKGSSRPSMESFIAFRGREPEMNALLRHSGIE